MAFVDDSLNLTSNLILIFKIAFSFSFSFSPAGVAPPPPPWSPRSAAAGPGHLPRPARWPPPASRRRLRDPVPAARRPPPPAGPGGPGARGPRPERASPPGSSACARPISSAEAPGTGSTRAGAACLDREPPQGPPARSGGARVRAIAHSLTVACDRLSPHRNRKS